MFLSWKSLTTMKKNKYDIELNIAQLAAIELASRKHRNGKTGLMQFVKTIALEWGRGSGKSTILGWFVKEAVKQMPGGTGIIVGETYQQILSRTLPSTKEGLNMFGIFEGIDYVVGKCGKSLGYEMPRQSPSNWDNVIHFSNGFIFILVSNDQPNAGRGINSCIVIGDEAALLDATRLFNNVQTTNRSTGGGEWEDAPLCNCEIYASSVAMTSKGQWFTDLEALAKLEPWSCIFIKAPAAVNKHNLAKDYFERMLAKSPSKIIYDAEIKNIRPAKVANGFYPSLDPKIHYYRDAYDYLYLQSVGVNGKKHDFNCKQDADYMKSKPFQVTIDWGNIMTMSVTQDQGERYRVLKTFHVSSPKIIDDLIDEEFAPYYEAKKEHNNVIEFYFDRNGNNRTPNARITFAEQAINVFKRNGWKVVVKVRKGSENPPHNEKFIVINYLLKYGGTNGLPAIEINEGNCHDMIISLENAPALEGNKPNTIIKDKRSEKSKTLPQEHATHFSDTFDIPLYWRYHKQVLRLIKQTDDRTSFPLFKGHRMS